MSWFCTQTWAPLLPGDPFARKSTPDPTDPVPGTSAWPQQLSPRHCILDAEKQCDGDTQPSVSPQTPFPSAELGVPGAAGWSQALWSLAFISLNNG